MEPIATLRGITAVLPRPHVDTDAILPARFLKGTSRSGLGRHLFHAWRFDAEGRPRADSPLQMSTAEPATILVAGENFGCGSSREHAVWALADFGFRAVVSTSIADIFRANALKNGLLPVVVEAEVHRRLLARPGTPIEIDIASRTLTLPEGDRASFPLDPFARLRWLEGVDEMGYLLGRLDLIEAFEAGRSAISRVEAACAR